MKLLVLSYAPLSLSNNGGKYLMSILDSFDNDDLLQFYISDRLPDVSRCRSYYHNTDMQTLKQRLGEKYNHIIEINDYEQEKNTAQFANRNHLKRGKLRSLKLIVRDVIWRLGKWDTKEFREWIENEKPDCILADTGDSCFLYRISMKIAKKYSLPIICSFGDDYYSLRANPFNLIKRFQLCTLRRTIKIFISFCNATITINDKFTKYYSEQFGLPVNKRIFTMCTGKSFDFSKEHKLTVSENSDLLIGYIGNLSLGRDGNLLELGRALEKYNKDHNTNHRLRINAVDFDGFSDKCKGIGAIDYAGIIPGSKVKDAILECDILIHTESFDEKYKKQTIYSLSTKIADSLASGRCLLAYGPSEIASMEHLIKNDCAYCITDKDKLYEKLSLILENPARCIEYSEKGRAVAQLYHNSEKNSELLYELVSSVVNDQNR